MKDNFFVNQKLTNDCGVACLQMIFNLYGIKENYKNIMKKTDTKKGGMSAFDIVKISKEHNLNAVGYKNFNIDDFNSPLIAHLIKDGIQHYIVILKVLRNKILIADPSSKVFYISKKDFEQYFSKIVITFDKTKPLNSVILDKKITFGITFFTVLLAIFSIISSYLFSKLLNNIEINVSYGILLLIFILNVSKEILFYVKNWLTIKFQCIIDRKLTLPILSKILNLPYKYYHDNGSGTLVSKVSDLSYVKEMILKMAEVMYVNIIFILFSFLSCLFINKWLFIINIFIISFFILLNKIFLSKYFYKVYDVQIKNETFNNMVVDSLNNIFTIKNLKKEKYFNDKFIDKYNNLIEDKLFINNKFIRKDLIQNVIITFINIIIIYILLRQGYNVGMIFFIVTIEGIIFDSITSIYNEMPLFMNFKSAYRRIIDLLNEKEEKDVSEKVGIKKIEYRNVKYKNIVKNFNLVIEKGDYVKIKGSCGCGKTTLLKMLTKEVKNNNIYINNKNINSYDDLKNDITYVGQKVKLFNDTIKNNISLGSNGYEKAYKVLNVNNKNNNLDYNYIIDNYNTNLSGGQVQKIVIAQTLCNSGDYIIFDETTSEIDEKEERKILLNIKKHYHDKTIILISHRSSNEDLFNKIVCLKKEDET